MSSVQMGLSAFNIPAIALGKAVCAEANRMAGMKLPTLPMTLTQSHCSRFRALQWRNDIGSRVNPAMPILNAASSIGGNKREPSDAKRPHFMRIKLLPQTKPRSNKMNTGNQRCWGGDWLNMACEIRICWVSSIAHQRIFVICVYLG